MQKIFADFIYTLRQQGLPVSPAETLDALHIAELLGFSDRLALRQGLGLALAKTTEHKLSYEYYFDQFFQFAESDPFDPNEPFDDSDDSLGDDPESSNDETESEQSAAQDSSASEDSSQPSSSLAQLLMEGNASAQSLAVAQAGADENVQKIQIFTQRPLFAYRMMNRMGNEALNQELIELDQSTELEDRQLGLQLRKAQQRLQDQVKDYVEQQYLLFAEAKGQQLRESNLQSIRLTNIDRHYMGQMSKLVRKAAKRLASLHSRKKKIRKRGMLDVRKTISANAAFDGVLFHTRWRSVTVDRPKIICLCDVSGSVSRVARFLLLFLHSLQDVLPRTRSFVFASDMGEVTQGFREKEIEEAIGDVMDKWANQPTNYGKALQDFKELALKDIDNKTTVIMLGDARNNNGESESGIWQDVYQRAGRVLWLNPEHVNSWDTGDSIMAEYRPYCSQVNSCNSLRDLERILSGLLKHS